MKCSQCDRPGLFRYPAEGGDLLLCVDCTHKLQMILESQQSVRDREWLKNTAMMNHALDEMDYMMPIAPSVGRIPVSEIARAMTKGSTYHNINVSNSNVGVLNR